MRKTTWSDRTVWVQGWWPWSCFHAFEANDAYVYHTAACGKFIAVRQREASCSRTLPKGRICKQCLNDYCLFELKE